MKFRSRYTTALDILQDRYVRCVHIKHSQRSWSVEKTSLKEIPPAEGDEDSSQDIHTAHTIKSLLQEMDIYPPENVVTCISGRDAAVRLLALPPVGDRKAKDIEEMVRYELMMHLPVNVEQMGYDYQTLRRSDDVTMILTAAAKRSVLDRHLRLLALAGVYPDVVTTSSLALFNAFARKEPEYLQTGRVSLVCLRDSDGDVVICKDGNLTYARSFTFQASGSKEQLIREIHNSFDTYSKSRSSESGDIERVYLVTEDGKLPSGLTEDELSRIASGTQWEVYPAGDDLALGLALAGTHLSGRPPRTRGERGDQIAPQSMLLPSIKVNLLKQIAREKRAAEKKVMWAKLGRMAPAIAVIALAIISGTLWWQVHQAREKLRSIEGIQQAGKQRIDIISRLGNMEKDLQKQMQSLDWVADNYPMVSYRLYQIVQTIPDSLWLKEVYIPERQTSRKRSRSEQQQSSTLYVVGYSHEQNHIEEFLEALRGCDCFSDVKQESTSEVRLAGERVLEFKISLTSNPHTDKSRIRALASTRGR